MKKVILSALLAFTATATSFAQEAELNAFEQLSLSSLATTAQVEVLTNAICGEMDPYILGDVCWHSVRVLGTNEDLFIYVSMDADELKAGDTVTIKYLQLTSGDFAGSIIAKKIN